MSFRHKLTKINRFLIVFGVSPCSYNEKINQFECSLCTLTYTLAYFLIISIAIIYMSFVYHLKNGELFQTTFRILIFLQYATIMTIFYATMIDLMLKRRMFANFLNNLVKLDTNLAKLNVDTSSADLTSLHKQHILIVFFYAFVYLTKSIIYANKFRIFEHVWNALNFFQTISLTMVGYYIRSFAIILTRRCRSVLEHLNFIRNDVFNTNDNQRSIVELLKCLESFDEIMILKNELSKIFGLQLLLNSAFDFIMLTISVYGMTYFIRDINNLYYFAAFNMPHAVKCILVVLALDTLADQIDGLRKCVLKDSISPNKQLSELMDLIFLKMAHMEKDKYVTANDFYPVNKSMLYGMGAAIITHMMIIFQFQQWEDSQHKNVQQNISAV